MYALCIIMPYIVGMGLTILRVVVFVRVVLEHGCYCGYCTWKQVRSLYLLRGEGLLLYSTGHYASMSLGVSEKAMEKGILPCIHHFFTAVDFQQTIIMLTVAFLLNSHV